MFAFSIAVTTGSSTLVVDKAFGDGGAGVSSERVELASAEAAPILSCRRVRILSRVEGARYEWEYGATGVQEGSLLLPTERKK